MSSTNSSNYANDETFTTISDDGIDKLFDNELTRILFQEITDLPLVARKNPSLFPSFERLPSEFLPTTAEPPSLREGT